METKVASDQLTYQRGATAAIWGLVVQLALGVGMGILGAYSGNAAVQLEMWHLLLGAPLWFVLIVLYNQHRQERIEALEAEQLAARQGVDATQLFDTSADDLAVARQRLEKLYKWWLNAVALGLGVLLLVIGGWVLWSNYGLFTEATREGASNRLYDEVFKSEAISSLVVMVSAAAGMFICFVVARYLSGMTRVQQWQMLRGGASYLMGNFVALLLIFTGGLFAYFGKPSVLGFMGLVLPGLLAVLGLEMLVSVVMSIYRPRKRGEMPRAAFDSRVLGFLTSPVSIAEIINETINYQFGFEVSRSWFYQLLGKAITPLCVFGLVVLVGMSSVVVVQPHEMGVVTNFGSISRDPLGPGLHLKLPWPIGRVQKYPVGRVQQVHVGSIISLSDEDQAILWTNEHTEGEEEYLLAAPTQLASAILRRTGEGQPATTATGKSLVAAEVVVQYVIRPDQLLAYVQSAEDPQDLLKRLAERRVNMFFAKRDIDQLLTISRTEAGAILKQQIQSDVDSPQVSLGVDLVLVAILNAHPPQQEEVAVAFQEQISALQEAEGEIRKAQRYYIETLTQAAGLEAESVVGEGLFIGERRIGGEVEEGLLAEMGGLAGLFEGLAYTGPRPRAIRIEDAIKRHEELQRRMQNLELVIDLLQGKSFEDADLKAKAERRRDEMVAELGQENLLAKLQARFEEVQKQFEQQDEAIELMLLSAGGEAAVRLYEARSERWRYRLSEEAAAAQFRADQEAYAQAPMYFLAKRYLNALANGLTDTRKFIVPTGDDMPEIRLNLLEALGVGALAPVERASE